MYILTICGIGFIYLVSKVFLSSPAKIGVYIQPGILSPLKQLIMYLLIKFRKSKSSESAGNSGAGYGVKSTVDVGQLEKAQDLGSSPLAIDAVLFSGGSKDGTYLVLSAARRQNGVVQCICVVKVPGVGILHHPLHPDTTMIQKNGEKGWKAEGIDLEPIEPMKKWRVRYTGDMILGQPDNSDVDIPTYHRVNLDAVYTSDLEYFDFDSDMEPMVISRAMAREPWNAAYFQKLREAHQNHYEQFGTVAGKLTIDQTEYDIGLSTMRDHTHGSSRDWKLMHRYGLHNFTTSSGLRGFLGIVSQPGIFSTLELGYIYTPDKQKHAVQEVDLDLWRLGEFGTDPSDYGFRFKAGDKWYSVQVHVIGREEVFFGHEFEARVIERFCRYEINGEEGWGVSEWEYRHRGGKPAS